MAYIMKDGKPVKTFELDESVQRTIIICLTVVIVIVLMIRCDLKETEMTHKDMGQRYSDAHKKAEHE